MFLVPLAIDEESKLYRPEEAKKDKTYFCPVCGEPVVLRQGNVRVAHFAHKTSIKCNQETILHKTAKLLVQKSIYDWKAGRADTPVIQRQCRICHTVENHPLPGEITDAILEYRLSEGYVVDVALMAGNVVKIAVEIKVTHGVDEVKTERLSVPFLELLGHDILTETLVWRPITERPKTFVCDGCKQKYKLAWSKFQAKAKLLAQSMRINLPTAYYRYGIYTCWKCKRDILVFTWPGAYFNNPPKMKPIPKTIRYRFSNTIGRKYWANICPYCNSIQGNHFLYFEPDGPFIGINNLFEEGEEDTPDKFRHDLIRIAVHSDENGWLDPFTLTRE
ncbi:competence protein CoiA family protein [Thermicanus aegyptius]|uniref:competence protein CoiA family protein n=1 Tax=Thermicanus aegyptius TaxID=94009 RepID=UPI0003F6FBFC|nr:competence protein CoiA family protein [Thermicanus aegyptius]